MADVDDLFGSDSDSDSDGAAAGGDALGNLGSGSDSDSDASGGEGGAGLKLKLDNAAAGSKRKGTGGGGGESKEGAAAAHQGPGAGGAAGAGGGGGGSVPTKADGSLDLFVSASLAITVSLRILGLGALTASVGGTIQSVFGGNGNPEKLVVAFLVAVQANPADPLRVGVEGLRAACHGGWVLVEWQLESMFLPALLCALGKAGGGGGGKGGSSGGSGKGGKGGKDGGTQAHHMYGEKGVPATVAAALAMHRNASCKAGVRAFAASVGKRGDVMEGVVRGAGGLVVEINWANQLGGDPSGRGRYKTEGGTLPVVGDLNMPGLRVLDLSSNFWSNSSLKGDIAQLKLPMGMQNVNFESCSGLTGDVGNLVLTEGMQTVNFYGCRGLTGTAER